MSIVYNIAIFPTSTLSAVGMEGGGVVSATPNKLFVVRANACTISVQGLFDNEEEQYWNTMASLTGTLLDEFGNVITTVNMTYASGSNGNFTGSFGNLQFLPAVGRGYTFVLQGISDWGNAFTFPLLTEVVNQARPTGVYSPPT
jgi:hypothetical protein